MCDVQLVVLYTKGTCLQGQSTTSTLQFRRCLASRMTSEHHTSRSPVLVPVICFVLYVMRMCVLCAFGLFWVGALYLQLVW